MSNIIEMKSICKSFGAVKALKNIDFAVRAGETMALVGENGAGKSTLMKVLTGVYTKDTGTILIGGEEVRKNNPVVAKNLGIAQVYQQFEMMDELSVTENICLGDKGFSKHGLVQFKTMMRQTQELLDHYHIPIDANAKVGTLSAAMKQFISIARVLYRKPRVIVFDEPTAVLSDSEVHILMDIIDSLKQEKVTIIYISHRMDEINQITDRVTVMRDGEYVGTLTTKDSTKDDIIQMMVGRTVYEEPKSFSNVRPDAPVVLKVEHLNVGKTVKDVSFELRKGEILGFSGLMGAGRTETARAIFGADRRDSGDIYVNGKRVDIKNPQDAVDAGIGYLSEDRKRYGVIIEKTVAENTTMASLKAFCKGLFIDKKAEKETAEQYVEALKTKTPSVEQQVRNLSGGNQQKVVIAKWLTRNCDILIFDEPTRGIDVGAKSEIYTLMNNLVKQGKSIIMISSELTEVLRMSDRILIMCEGRKTGEISIEEATQEKIMHAATLRD